MSFPASSISRAALLTALISISVRAQQTRDLSLDEAIQLATSQGGEISAARAQQARAQATGRALRAGLRPQVNLNTTLLNFDHGINQVTLPDGSQQFVGQSNNLATAALGVTQQVVATGGTVSLNTLLGRSDQFGNLNRRSWTSTPLLLSVSQPLFGVRSKQWDLIESDAAIALGDKQFEDTRASVVRAVASSYFALHRVNLILNNAEVNAAVADTVFAVNAARYKLGTVGVLEMSRSELSSLKARMAVEEARLSRDRASASLALMLGLADSLIIATHEPSLPDTTGILTDKAIRSAVNSGLTSFQIRADSLAAARQVATATAGSRIGANLVGSIGFNQVGETFPLAYESPLGKQRATLGVSLPLMQWGAGRATIEAARLAGEATLTRDRLTQRQAEAEARFAARSVASSARQLQLATISDSIANIQFRVARVQYTSGAISYTEFLTVQQEKDNTVVARVDALAKLWDEYYNLARLTGFDKTR